MPSSPPSESAAAPAAGDAPPVTFFKRSSKAKPKFRKRAATPPSASSSSDSDSDTPDGPRAIKKRKTGSAITASSASSQLAASNAPEIAPIHTNTSSTITSSAADEATKRSDWYDADKHSKESSTHRADADLIGKPDAAAVAALAESGKYAGAAAYGNFIARNPDREKQGPKGPLRASANVRTITITDYAPDVCKDYKLTGFCGFGDTCKFLHAREDYAAGWKLDREWEINQKTGGKPIPQNLAETEEDKELKDIPFKCVICKGDYKDPIVTKCNHYFCEMCAIKRYKKNPSCKICGKRTDGVFNVAKNLRAKLERKKEREEEIQRRKEEIEAAEAAAKT
ncbi:hypothetical protein EX30DRAFT_337441 [Ascodesmis nigricans]|uniref:Pre-mRNA-splicing factor CWC24 n=1 Tax=Ascodesmis nigricans TaxID=341454 RepID=A0A4S2N7A6_9PEZI|nr:hypothetical protein EX30DRAFT_337441 [Ascodesmis nigricans]